MSELQTLIRRLKGGVLSRMSNQIDKRAALYMHTQPHTETRPLSNQCQTVKSGYGDVFKHVVLMSR